MMSSGLLLNYIPLPPASMKNENLGPWQTYPIFLIFQRIGLVIAVLFF